DLCGPGSSEERSSDRLLLRAHGDLPSDGFVRRPHSAWRKARQSAGSRADQVRAHDQPQDRNGVRIRNFTVASRPRRRGDRMNRRAFITLLAGAAAAWPLAARAQQPERIRRIGVLIPFAESDTEAQMRLRAFEETFRGLGWVDGHNVRIERRWASGDSGRIRAFAKELTGLEPDVILAHSTPA